ncbi:hypothetical protein CONLIGDRAFT_635700 [Coniochaeta ligniaria NRRL 30616]|uniref:DUF7730 domain-containing protein n=1 Tax=Coniochaeta ligniaria NRRL 30616 TaxID=1408157 RepID=A0A1J7IXX7_9PEZI|nr:hypothetical protein CONLIGDRAFT_635700 [Coniochaeta ligniaria NRRL 30616]
MDNSAIVVDQSCADEVCISFLHLPLEIRQQIYRHVLDAHPRVERELPGYPARGIRRYVTSRITRQNQSASIAREAASYQPLPSSKPLGYIPRNLLCACKQIYTEARLVPFQTNELVFTEWMTSAVSYCEAVLRPMQSWQRAAIRHVRFTMGLHELYDRPANEHGLSPSFRCRLEHVCALLPGVRTMRINLSSGDFPTAWFEKGRDRDETTMKEDWSGGRRWIDEGLRKMGSLRVVEIECSFLVWMTPAWLPRAEKQRVEEELALRWCAKVEEILNEGRPDGMRTRVFAVTSVGGSSPKDSCSGMEAGPLAEADALTLSFMPSSLGVDFSGTM